MAHLLRSPSWRRPRQSSRLRTSSSRRPATSTPPSAVSRSARSLEPIGCSRSCCAGKASSNALAD